MNFKWTEHQFHTSHCIFLRFIIQINNETLRERKICEFGISLSPLSQGMSNFYAIELNMFCMK